jgi:hypothetical protein
VSLNRVFLRVLQQRDGDKVGIAKPRCSSCPAWQWTALQSAVMDCNGVGVRLCDCADSAASVKV